MYIYKKIQIDFNLLAKLWSIVEENRRISLDLKVVIDLDCKTTNDKNIIFKKIG